MTCVPTPFHSCGLAIKTVGWGVNSQTVCVCVKVGIRKTKISAEWPLCVCSIFAKSIVESVDASTPWKSWNGFYWTKNGSWRQACYCAVLLNHQLLPASLSATHGQTHYYFHAGQCLGWSNKQDSGGFFCREKNTRLHHSVAVTVKWSIHRLRLRGKPQRPDDSYVCRSFEAESRW